MNAMAEATRKLRARYIEGLPTKRRVIQEALAAKTAGDPDAEAALRRIAHQIRGSAASYGFLQIDSAAYRLEYAETSHELELAANELIIGLHDAYRSQPSPVMTILLVEDDPAIGPLLESLLSEERVQLTQVLTAAAAREQIEAGQWSVILIDLVLPDDDGRRLLTEIRAAPGHRDTPLIVLSARTGSLVKNECAMYGIDLFIEKPIDPATFAVTIASVLDRARSLEAAADDDALTGLPNRAGFRRAFEALRLLSERNGRPLSLALIEFGDRVGDAALIRAAHCLERSLRHANLLGRWSSDEFIVGFPETDTKAAIVLLDAAARHLRELPDLDDPNPVRLSGGVTRLEPGETLDFGLLRTEQLLYQVKVTGRGRSICLLEPADDGRPTLLFAEDDPDSAAVTLRDLRDAFEVTHVFNGGDALEAAKRERFNIVILDYHMPGKDGIELTRQFRQLAGYRKTPILLLTAVGSDAAIEQAFAAGADDYITKPQRRGPMLARLFRHLGRVATPAIDESPRAPETVESMVTAMVCDFVDMQGKSAGSSVGPDPATLHAYISAATPIVIHRDGEITKLRDNVLLAVFGASALQIDDAARALQAAVEIQRAILGMPAVSRPLAVRIGLHSSLVTVASVAGKHYIQEKAIGELASVAHQMSGTIGAGGIVMDALTVELSSPSSSSPPWPLSGPVPWQVHDRSIQLYRVRWR